MLGSTMYCTKWWAKDIDEAICKPQFLPHAFDCFGYATTVIGGGITGTVLYLAINSGALLTITVTNSGEPRVSFAFFVAFVVDYFTLK